MQANQLRKRKMYDYFKLHFYFSSKELEAHRVLENEKDSDKIE
jgi:hypothetical protein